MTSLCCDDAQKRSSTRRCVNLNLHRFRFSACFTRTEETRWCVIFFCREIPHFANSYFFQAPFLFDCYDWKRAKDIHLAHLSESSHSEFKASTFPTFLALFQQWRNQELRGTRTRAELISSTNRKTAEHTRPVTSMYVCVCKTLCVLDRNMSCQWDRDNVTER